MESADKIVLTDVEPPIGAASEQLASTIIARIGLVPRKRGSTEHMHKTFIEFYERMKKATAQKDPRLAVMTVEEMAIFAKISRQTMYEYLQRWLTLGVIIKVSFIDTSNKVIIGYKLNGSTLEDAFSKAKTKIASNLDQTHKYVCELQKMLKNEKISQTLKRNSDDPDQMTLISESQKGN